MGPVMIIIIKYKVKLLYIVSTACIVAIDHSSYVCEKFPIAANNKTAVVR